MSTVHAGAGGAAAASRVDARVRVMMTESVNGFVGVGANFRHSSQSKTVHDIAARVRDARCSPVKDVHPACGKSVLDGVYHPKDCIPSASNFIQSNHVIPPVRN
jgi:hypothetical protein